MLALTDYTGRRFGKLTVVAMAERLITPKQAYPRCICRCDCGGEVVAFASNIRGGKTTSCGCHRERFRRVYGVSPNDCAEYRTWLAMWDRCTNPKNKRYAGWGGRGIRVCDQWKDFATFYKDMGKRPGRGLSIDRIDNDGNYEPGNVRWATAKEQANNRRNNRVYAQPNLDALGRALDKVKTRPLLPGGKKR